MRAGILSEYQGDWKQYSRYSPYFLLILFMKNPASSAEDTTGIPGPTIIKTI
jgi:hypothetical protein